MAKDKKHKKEKKRKRDTDERSREEAEKLVLSCLVIRLNMPALPALQVQGDMGRTGCQGGQAPKEACRRRHRAWLH